MHRDGPAVRRVGRARCTPASLPAEGGKASGALCPQEPRLSPWVRGWPRVEGPHARGSAPKATLAWLWDTCGLGPVLGQSGGFGAQTSCRPWGRSPSPLPWNIMVSARWLSGLGKARAGRAGGRCGWSRAPAWCHGLHAGAARMFRRPVPLPGWCLPPLVATFLGADLLRGPDSPGAPLVTLPALLFVRVWVRVSQNTLVSPKLGEFAEPTSTSLLMDAADWRP